MKPIIFLSGLIVVSCAAMPEKNDLSPKAGKEIAFNRDKGNCLACHQIEDGEFPGNIGPELKSLNRPPFGKNKILNEQEIDLIVDYLWGLP
jgi:L-cysteine S-thiosulfotransferase